MRAPVETMIKSNRCSVESITTRELDHLDHLVVLFVYLHTPRFRSLRTEKEKRTTRYIPHEGDVSGPWVW